MKTIDTDIKKQVEAFVPAEPESYSAMIRKTVSELNNSQTKRPGRQRKIWKPFVAAAAAVTALLVSCAAVFGARPALAANVPIVKNIVYAAAPERAAGESDRQRIETLLDKAFGSLAECDYKTASACFCGSALGLRGNYLAAAYLYHLVAYDMFPAGSNAQKLEISALSAEQKAYRFTADVTLSCISRDGKSTGAEECTVVIVENTKGMFIESIQMLSEGYKEYAAMYESAFGPVPDLGADVELIPLDNSFLTYKSVFAQSEGARQRADRLSHLLARLEELPAAIGQKAARELLIETELKKADSEITPEFLTAEDAAAELMYRYWLGAKTGEACDLSDIAERNEQTDLFYWDALLKADAVRLGALKPLTTVEAGSAMLLEMLESTDDIVKASFYVQTDISDGVSQGVGEEIILTLKREGAGFIVVGFDRQVGDGKYVYSLKPLAAQYKAEGRTWQEAGKLAYDVLYEELVKTAELYPAD